MAVVGLLYLHFHVSPNLTLAVSSKAENKAGFQFGLRKLTVSQVPGKGTRG